MPRSPELQVATQVSDVNPADGLTYAVGPQRPGQTSRQPEILFSRREFLKIASLSAAGLGLAACTPGFSEYGNASFVSDLERKIGFAIKDDTPDEEIWQFLTSRTYDPKYNRWMKNTSLGKVNTPKGAMEIFTDSRGEPDLAPPVNLTYPLPLPEQMADRKKYIDKLDFPNDISVYVAGTSGTRGRIAAQKDKLNDFVQDYFKFSKAKKKVLHLNFLPFTRVYIPEGMPPKIIVVNTSGATYIVDNPRDTQDIEEFDVVISFNFLHVDIDYFGLPIQSRIRGIFSNEYANMMARDKLTTPDGLHANEAPSTIFDFLASFDDTVARKVLGTHYEPIFKVFEEEMEILKKIGTKKPVAHDITRRDLFKAVAGGVLSMLPIT